MIYELPIAVVIPLADIFIVVWLARHLTLLRNRPKRKSLLVVLSVLLIAAGFILWIPFTLSAAACIFAGEISTAPKGTFSSKRWAAHSNQ
jgi:hypothetical protein